MTQAALAQILRGALEDEHKAEATYGAVIEKFGPVRPFVRIIEAERRHAAALERQMLRLGITIPTNTWSGKGVAPASLAKACEEAPAAEIENIALYDRLLPSVADQQVLRVLTNLRQLPATGTCRPSGVGLSEGPVRLAPKAWGQPAARAKVGVAGPTRQGAAAAADLPDEASRAG